MVKNGRFGAVDIGTNTVKVKIVDITQSKQEQLLYRDFPSGLGKNQNRDHTIDVSGLSDLLRALEEIKKILSDNNVEAYQCIGTHALRVATNQEEITALIKSKLNMDVRVISCEEETRLTVIAVSGNFNGAGGFICINVGGGSTEMGFHLPGGDQLICIDLGAVNLKQNLLAGKNVDAALEESRLLIKEKFDENINFEIPDDCKVISLGGSIFSAGYIFKKDREKKFYELEGLRIPLTGLESVINLLKNADEKSKGSIAGLDEKRANTILPGIWIHYTLLKLLHRTELQISTVSISDGLIYEMAGKKE
jgi:exopolyphosphatase/guanosine-5'-triphosphate,3'-diphosphate pyrophosphatase